MSGSPYSPLARLVLFMICLSVAGAFVAGVHYFAADLPQQKALKTPTNNAYIDCIMGCSNRYMGDPDYQNLAFICQKGCSSVR